MFNNPGYFPQQIPNHRSEKRNRGSSHVKSSRAKKLKSNLFGYPNQTFMNMPGIPMAFHRDSSPMI